MLTEKEKEKYYKAMLEKDKSYEGIFFVGVKTTGVFCHSTCPAKKPKYENCEFYSTSKEALLSGYRPCKRCRPLSNPSIVSPKIQVLIDSVENNPEKKWKDIDFQNLGISSSSVRRQFYKRFGMTFIEYARSRRLGIALKTIKNGSRVIDAQLDAGFESDSGLRDAFKNTLGIPFSTKKEIKQLYSQWIDTKIGSMLAISDEEELYLLEFVDRRGLETEITKMKKRLNAVIIPKKTKPLIMIEKELKEYFENSRIEFKTPVAYIGSEFLINVWNTLRTINSGKTMSYSELADLTKNPQAVRAVARANGLNQLAIIVPCHRIIAKDGTLGGYGGGLVRKKWLLNHEGVNI